MTTSSMKSLRATRQSRRTEHAESTSADGRDATLPVLLTVADTADLLRTSSRAIYAMVERRQLPGVIRVRRRVLFRTDDLLNWLHQKRAPSLQE